MRAKLPRWLFAWLRAGCVALLAGQWLGGCSATGLGPAPCDFGYSVCEGPSGLSICVDLQNDDTSCGACGMSCAQGRVCSSGQCVSACGTGETICATSHDAGSDASTAYCAKTTTDNANCGGCGVACKAQEVCVAGQCASSCVGGQSLCSPDGGAPYCALLASDNANCGACGVACAAQEVCVAGACASSCVAGQSLCSPDGGAPYCALLASDNANCGGCGNACGVEQICAAGSCASACAAGQSLCAPDGGAPYCATLSSDNANCGGCGNACGAEQICSAGSCASACAAGQSLCTPEGGAPYCANTRTDNGNCGACGNACSPGLLCAQGACGSTCPGGQVECTTDGGGPYCATVESDNANCGTCGHACGLQEVCFGGACVSSAGCSNSQLVCLEDGGGTLCIDPLTDNGNCGACGHVCGPVHYCAAGVCQSGCTSAQTLCTPDGGAAYCASTESDNANCGACGLACGANQACVGGTCVGGDAGVDSAPPTFTVGGTLTGLGLHDMVTLVDNGSDDLVLIANGPFTFPKPLLTGSAYAVTLTSPSAPIAQTCVVTSGTGTVGSAPVTTVAVDCTTNTYTLTVTLTGLALPNSVEAYSVGGDITFPVGSGGGTLTFPNPLPSGSTFYGIDGVATGPDYQFCFIPATTITNMNGTVTGSCGFVSYTVGGTITGLAPGDTFTLENEGDDYIVDGNGAFTFSERWMSGVAYDVIVITDPAYPVAQTCVVSSGGSGTITDMNITTVEVTCM